MHARSKARPREWGGWALKKVTGIGLTLLECFLSIRRCDHDRVAVQILDPKLEVSRVRIDVNVSHDRRFELTSAHDCFLKVVHFEPEQNAVSNRLGRVANRTMMMIGMPIVQLQDQPVTAPFARVEPCIPQSLIFGTTMPPDAAEQPLIPSARCLDVPTEDEWMCAHAVMIKRGARGCHPASAPHATLAALGPPSPR
jgi:hypothetical protein